MLRTPTNGNEPEAPSGKLGAVTRKRHEIEELLAHDPPPYEEVQKLFSEYLTKVEHLYGAALEGGHGDWLAPHKVAIDNFRERVEFALSSQRGATGRAASSIGSSTASTSSARIKLAQRKAKLAAEKILLEKSVLLDQEEIKLKAEQLRVERDRKQAAVESAELENRILEKELDLLDAGGSASSQTSSHSTRSSTRLVPPVATNNSYTPSDPVFQVLVRQNEISQKLVENQEQSSLPKRDLRKFDGSDITEYKVFKQSFTRIIGNKCSSASEKLAYLEQYTAGHAQKLVRSCVHSDADIAWREASLLLDKEYGNEFEVATAYLKKLSNWNAIKPEDVSALQDLHLFLLKCNCYLEDSSPGNPINSPREIMQVIMKLPYKMREKWRLRTYHMIESDEIVGFRHFVKFVGDEVSLLKQPLFGEISDPKRDSKYTDKPKRNCATTTVKDSSLTIEQTPYCDCCKRTNHRIDQCAFLKKKSDAEKSDFVKRAGLCFGCLQKGHLSKDCKDKRVCSKCRGPHPTILHKDRNSSPNLNRNPTSNDTTIASEVDPLVHTSAKSNSSYGAGKRPKVMCPVVPARVRCGSGNELIVNVALDSHSTDCWINDELVRRLGAVSEDTTLTISTMESSSKEIRTSIVRNLQLSSMDSSKTTEIPYLYTKPSSSWPFSKNDVPTYKDIEHLSYLSDTPFEFIDVPVDILIGMNVPGLLKCHATVDRKLEEPFASLHWLGWAFNGPISGHSVSSCKRSIVNTLEIEKSIENLFAHDFKDSDLGSSASFEDDVWADKVSSSIGQLPSGNYQICLPFRDDNVNFPANRDHISTRFSLLCSRFKRNSGLFREYSGFMKEMIDNDYVEPVPGDEPSPKTGKVWYLPHHAVYHKQKRKIRVVFDCSAKFRGVSLNDQLLQGPDLSNNLVGVLLRFRTDVCAFTGDIQKMFYQVQIPPEQRNFLRFLWLDEEFNVKDFRLKVHVFGARSSPSIANFALKQTALEYAKTPSVHQAILNNFYVDDLLKSTGSSSKAINLMNDIKDTLSFGGFNLTSFCSNSPEVISFFQCTPKVEPVEIDISDRVPSSKVLGLTWETESDHFKYSFTYAEETVTRRSVLRTVASVYDPLGMILPVLVTARKIFQETCRLRLAWDDPLPASLLTAWNKWTEGMRRIADYRVPRCIGLPAVPCRVQLHVFCDGSEIAYGAVAYVAFLSADEVVVSSPVLVKARLTPLGNSTLKTVPRIELCAAKLAIDVFECLLRNLEFSLMMYFFGQTLQPYSDTLITRRKGSIDLFVTKFPISAAIHHPLSGGI